MAYTLHKNTRGTVLGDEFLAGTGCPIATRIIYRKSVPRQNFMRDFNQRMSKICACFENVKTIPWNRFRRWVFKCLERPHSDKNSPREMVPCVNFTRRKKFLLTHAYVHTWWDLVFPPWYDRMSIRIRYMLCGIYMIPIRTTYQVPVKKNIIAIRGFDPVCVCHTYQLSLVARCGSFHCVSFGRSPVTGTTLTRHSPWVFAIGFRSLVFVMSCQPIHLAPGRWPIH